MDHMRISVTEPSSVILNQKKYLNKWLKIDTPKVPKYKLKPKGMV